jgi:hypothetical protein
MILRRFSLSTAPPSVDNSPGDEVLDDRGLLCHGVQDHRADFRDGCGVARVYCPRSGKDRRDVWFRPGGGAHRLQGPRSRKRALWSGHRGMAVRRGSFPVAIGRWLLLDAALLPIGRGTSLVPRFGATSTPGQPGPAREGDRGRVRRGRMVHRAVAFDVRQAGFDGGLETRDSSLERGICTSCPEPRGIPMS